MGKREWYTICHRYSQIDFLKSQLPKTARHKHGGQALPASGVAWAKIGNDKLGD
jgi:hypothetical protein